MADNQAQPTIKDDLEEYEKRRNKSYDLSKYNVSVGNFQYPENLGTAPDLRHFVAFYINVRDKSRLQPKNELLSENEVPVISATQRKNGNAWSTALVTSTALTTAATAVGIKTLKDSAVRLKGKSAAQTLKNTSSFLFTGGITALSTAYIATEAIKRLPVLSPTKFKRLKDVVTLHVEDRPSVKYGVKYNNKSLGILAGFAASTASAKDTFKNNIGEAAALGLAQAAKIPNAIGGATLADLLGAAAGVQINPYNEVLFESIDYRTFSFRYRFFPKSEKETRNVKNIIDKFKEHMHPELTSSGFFYIYPSEFDIVYYFVDEKGDTKENVYFHRIGNCVLTDMGVEYGGDSFSTFSNGAPTQVNLTLTFREVELLTKREMQRGF